MEDPSESDLDIESTDSWSLQMTLLLGAFDKVSQKLAGYGNDSANALEFLSELRSKVLRVQELGEAVFQDSDSEHYKDLFSVQGSGVRDYESLMLELLVRIAGLICVPEFFYTLSQPSELASLPNGATQLASFYQKLEAHLNREGAF
ncbi:MAG: hypothetical protein WC777_04400 [Candidatus Gracilibacteria bacterium]|jgi:hypothetical protein